MKQAVVLTALLHLPSPVFHLGLQFDDLHLEIIVFLLHLRQLFFYVFKLDLCGDQFVFQIVHFFVFQLDIALK